MRVLIRCDLPFRFRLLSWLIYLVDLDLNLAVISLLLIGLWEANLIKVNNIYKLCQILIKLTLNNLIKSDLVKSRRFG